MKYNIGDRVILAKYSTEINISGVVSYIFTNIYSNNMVQIEFSKVVKSKTTQTKTVVNENELIIDKQYYRNKKISEILD